MKWIEGGKSEGTSVSKPLFLVFGILLGLSTACVDGSKIDRTNETLMMNLEELKKINDSFNQGTAQLKELERPMYSMADRFDSLINLFERRDEDFTRFVQQGIRASEEVVRLMQNFQPEDVAEYRRQLSEISASLASFNRVLVENEADFHALTSQLANGTEVLAQVGLALGLVDENELGDLDRDYQDVADSTRELGLSAKERNERMITRVKEVIREALDLEGISKEPLDILKSLSTNLNHLNGQIEKINELVDPEDLEFLRKNLPELLKTAKDVKTLSNRAVELDRWLNSSRILGPLWRKMTNQQSVADPA